MRVEVEEKENKRRVVISPTVTNLRMEPGVDINIDGGGDGAASN